MLALIMTVWIGARGWLVTRDGASLQARTMRSGQMLSSAPTPHRMASMSATFASRPTPRPGAGPIAQAPAAHRRESPPARAVVAFPSFPISPLPPARDETAVARELATSAPGKVARLDAVSRWSGDGWLLLRGGGGTSAFAAGAASYGASQAGAVLRYRLAAGTVRSPYAYLRASTAIGTAGQDRELAAGLAARPLADLPLRLLLEARVRDGVGTSPASLRPALLVVTELPRRDLPSGFRAEAYAQAGYVAGRNATPFFDAQLVVDHQVSPGLVPALEPRLGLGIWSGGQRGAARLDLGPRASVRLDALAGKPLVLALDWRLRAAGSARPDSGPTLTVASSF
ncbi:MAG: hypothetical protein ACOVKV_16565 [Novosphingobium sp.]